MTTPSPKNKKTFQKVTLENAEGVPPEEMKAFEDNLNKHLKDAYDNPQPGDDDEVTDLPEYVPMTGETVQAVFVNKTPQKNNVATQEQADAVAEGQLMAMFGETIESTKEWMKRIDKKNRRKKLLASKPESPSSTDDKKVNKE